MNRKECPACGRLALRIATRCPGCGFDLTTVATPKEEPPPDAARFYRIAGIAGVVLLVLGAITVGALTHEPAGDTAGVPSTPIRAAAVADPDTAQPVTGEPASVPAVESLPPPVTARTITAEPPPSSPTTRPTPPAGELDVRWAGTWINVREGKGTDYPVVRILRPGERVEVTKPERGWRFVYIDGEPIGYADNSLLQPDSLGGTGGPGNGTG